MVVKVPFPLATPVAYRRAKDAAWADLVVVPRVLAVEHRVTEGCPTLTQTSLEVPLVRIVLGIQQARVANVPSG